MPYNSYFPVGYQPVYPQYNWNPPQSQTIQQTQQQTPTNQQMTSNIIWVQGEAGAKSYLVAPNTSVQLWDTERDTIYIKSADASGMPSIKILDYTVRETPQNNAPAVVNTSPMTFATKEEVNTLADQIATLRGDFEGLVKRSASKSKKEVVENE